MKKKENQIRQKKQLQKTAKKFLRMYDETISDYPNINTSENFQERVLMVLPRFGEHLFTHPGKRTSIFNQLLPILALMAAVHTVLREDGWTVEQIARLGYEVFYSYFTRIPRVVRKISRNYMVSPLFSAKMKKICQIMAESDRSETFDIRYSYEKKPEKATMMTCFRCGMISFMQRSNMIEMYSYCNIFDFAQADAFGIGLVQPECIGAGDRRCMYRFTRNASDTRYPANVRRILATKMEL